MTNTHPESLACAADGLTRYGASRVVAVQPNPQTARPPTPRLTASAAHWWSRAGLVTAGITLLCGTMASADDYIEAVLGPTILVSADTAVTEVAESVAMSEPWVADADGILLGSRRAVAVAWPLTTAARSIAQALWFADGQCFPGGPTNEDTTSGSVQWSSGSIIMEVPLSSLSAYTAAGVARPSGVVDADRVTLRNGDVVDGLITRFSGSITIDVGGNERTIERSLIASVQFVQPEAKTPSPRTRARLRVWLDDGTIVDASRIERDGVTITLSADTVGLDRPTALRARVDQVLGIATQAVAWNGVTLRSSAATPSTTATVAPFISSYEVIGPRRLGLIDAQLRGPGQWFVGVPSAGALVFDVRTPESAQRLATHTLVVRQGGTELARVPASEPRHLSVAVAAGDVELQLSAGASDGVACVTDLTDVLFVSQQAP